MKKVAILQARLNSSRLPRRVLAELAGRPVIQHILDRLKASQELDEICVAIPEGEGDDELAQAVAGRDIHLTRGPEANVLTRFIVAAHETRADIIVRVAADNPLVDAEIMDEQVRYIVEHPEADYVFTKDLPLGISTETFTQKTLDKLDFLARTPQMRKNVTYYLVENPAPFNIVLLDPPPGLAFPHFRLTLGTEEDLAVLEAIYDELYTEGGVVSTKAAIDLLLARPELARVNEHVVQPLTRLAPSSGKPANEVRRQIRT